MVWPSIEWDAMGGRGFGFWWCWCRRLDSTEGEAKKERGRDEEGEGVLSLGFFFDTADFFFLTLGTDRSGAVVVKFFFFSCLCIKRKIE